MTTLKVVLTVLHLIIAFGLMAVVLFQSSKSEGLSGSIAGGAETFFGKNKGKTMDGVLAKLTVVLAILFVITSVSLSALSKKSQDASSDSEQDVVAEYDEEVNSDADADIDSDVDVDVDVDADAEVEVEAEDEDEDEPEADAE